MPHVTNDADDAPIGTEIDDLPKSIPARPERPRHRFIDHDDLFARRRVPLGEIAAVAQRNSHRPEVSVAHYAHKGVGILPRRVLLPLSARTPTAVAAERKRIRQSG